MIPIDALLAPLQALLAGFGTGSLPSANPAQQLRSTTGTLTTVNNSLTRAGTEVDANWNGLGKIEAVATIDRNRSDTAQLADNSTDIADVIEDASQKVQRGMAELTELLESFVATATAIGPTLFTPAGVAAIIPVAISHLERGLAVVERVRGELKSDADKLLRVGQQDGTDPRTKQLARIGSELNKLGEAAFGPVAASATNTGDAGTRAAALGATPTNDTGNGVAIKLPDGKTVYAPNERAAVAVRAALSKQGLPYVWGGTDPNSGFDCSGFTQWAYRQAGVELPRLAQEQDSAGIPVSQSNLMPGDLAVWDGHVAMYIGNGQLVETGGDPVGVTALRTSNAGQGFQGFFRPR